LTLDQNGSSDLPPTTKIFGPPFPELAAPVEGALAALLLPLESLLDES
jgi:hypothetical protein